MANDKLVVSFWFSDQCLEVRNNYANRFLSGCNRWTIKKHDDINQQDDLMFISRSSDETLVRTAISFKPKMVLIENYGFYNFDGYEKSKVVGGLALYVRKDLHYADEIDETSPNYAPSKNVLKGCWHIKQGCYYLDIETLSCRLADLLDAEDLYEKKKRKNQDVTVEA